MDLQAFILEYIDLQNQCV